jgi:hypothetical protein
MSRHLQIELTSRAPEGGWTWRAAGARQPRGTLDAGLLPEAVAVGAVLRAEVESTIDGIEVVAVTARQERREPTVERIEVLGTPRSRPEVSVAYAREGRGRPGGRGPRRDRDDGRADRSPAAARSGRGRRSAEGGADGAERQRDRRAPAARERGAPATRDRRPPVSSVHRNAALAALRPEQLPIAEQLVRGGIPAVRQAIDEQNAAAKAQGRPAVAPEPFLAMAEELLPIVNLAAWKDRASAAQAQGRELRIRDLRAVVAASRTVGLDDEGRTMARALEQSLEERVGALGEEWVGRITTALDEGRVADALRISSRPPEPGTRVSAELATRLAGAAGEAMAVTTPPATWLDLLDAAVESPVRRTVRPSGIPDDPDVQAAAHKAAGLVPELAKLLGLRIPPPPPPRGGVRSGQLSRAGGARPRAGS